MQFSITFWTDIGCVYAINFSEVYAWMTELILKGFKMWCLHINSTYKLNNSDNDASAEVSLKVSFIKKKVMICCWWKMQGIVYEELLHLNLTLLHKVTKCDQWKCIKSAWYKNVLNNVSYPAVIL